MLLLTRPLNDSLALKVSLENTGVSCHIEPILTIIPLTGVFNPATEQAYIITSKHALDSTYPFDYDKPLFVVGKECAALAIRLGFKKVYGDCENVLQLIQRLKDAPYRDYTYLRGRDITCDLKTHLRGKNIQEHIIYKADLCKELSKQTVELLKNNQLNWVSFFSTRTARHFCNLARAHHLPLNCTALCFSEKIQKSLTADGLFSKTILTPSLFDFFSHKI